MFVSDGAGSAAKGGVGSETAIEAAATFIDEKLASPGFSVCNELARECVSVVRGRIAAVASSAGLASRDYACTFLGVISSIRGTVVFQIGDGGVAIDVGNGLEVPVVPMSGEYANMTHFVTDEDALHVLEIKVFPFRALRVAAFSDGIQRLALNMASNTPHEPFFNPFFAALATAKADQEDQLQNALLNFLDSAAVNERTDDDKTLALALLVD